MKTICKPFLLLVTAVAYSSMLNAAESTGSQSSHPSTNSATGFTLASWWNGDLIREFYGEATNDIAQISRVTTEACTRGVGKMQVPAIRFNPNYDTFMDTQEWKGQFQRYMNNSGATADWFGLGGPLRQNGFTMQGVFKYVYFGQVSGGFPQSGVTPRSNFIPEVRIKFNYDFKPLFGLDGLTILSDWRYRGVAGNNPAYAAGTTGTTSSWNPTDMSSGFGMRMMQQYLQYANKCGFLNVGMENPYDQFLQQPLSKLFENNMINSTKGIGVGAGPGLPVHANNGKTNLYSQSSVGWSSSYLAWGGTLRVRPSRSTYIQTGLYEAIANATGVSQTPQFTATSVYPYASVPSSYMGQFKTPNLVTPNLQPNGSVNPKTPTKSIGNQQVFSQNHGFNTAGAPNNNSTGGMQGLYSTWSGNGLYSVNEIGWIPKLGKDQLDGKYAVGYYIWGLPNCSYTPWNYNQTVPGKVAGSSYNSTIMGIYLQADQMLFRHHDLDATASSDGKSVADGKNPAPAAAKSLSDRGLYSFSSANFSNPDNTAMPFYFQTGLVWKGLFDARPADQIGAVVGCGFYSQNFNNYQGGQNTYTQGAYAALPAYTSTEVIEGFYNIQFTKWLSFKPYAQCLVNPAGNGTLGTDWTLGARLFVVF
jgi:Carbohydrate-selective porin, OprB family